MKHRLSQVVDRVEREHGRVIITEHGRPAAVVLNIEDLLCSRSRLSVLSDPSSRDACLGKVRLTWTHATLRS